MKFTFLGTGTSQGVPVIACSCRVCQSADARDKRLRTSALIEHEGTTIVIDAGPDFRQQMLTANVKRLDAILLTHEHRDHIAGLDDVRAFNWVQQKPMDIWAEQRVQESLRKEFAYIFAETKYPGVPEVVMNSIDGHPFEVNQLKIIPIRCFHNKLPIYGFRIGDITYITDANFISEEEKEKIVGSKYIIINALRRQKHMSHFCLSDAIKLISEFSPRKGFIIHVSHQVGLYVDLLRELPDNINVAYDGLSFEVEY
ncbi:MAG: MBL fold metallo-hydrolase [Bacteroidales bacterium]|nr:MAG: MBL fold metallo-hydrolase [Bacteroidales bacterium]